MKCEQFLFEVSYLLESGDCEDLAPDAFRHLHQCAQCEARFRRFRQQHRSMEIVSPPSWMSQRLHQAIDLVLSENSMPLGQRAPSAKMWLQMAFTCLILVGSIVGIAYQNHPTVTPPVIAHR
jgi:hypothetical protein